MGGLSTLSTLSALLLVPAVLSLSDWTYRENTGAGPSHWGGQCRGSRQSPIDIESQGLPVSPLLPLTMTDYDQVPVSSLLENNGHAAKLSNTYHSGLTPHISGAGLTNNYKFGQVHFHWGEDSSRGSEHTINGQRFPLEMHLVHFNANFKDINLAVSAGEADSLAVLGIFFNVSSSPHPGVERLLPYLRQVTQAGSQVNVTSRFPLSDLVTGDLTELFRYSGGLTTPSCDEIVEWTVVKTPVEITEQQLAEFRQLVTKEGTPLVDNFRPTQSLNSRQVLHAETASARWCSANHPSVRASSTSLQVPLGLLLSLIAVYASLTRI